MRNNPKPGEKIDWDATGNIVTPNAGRKTSGWLFDVKPPAEHFNWFWNLVDRLGIYHSAQVEDWIVIDSDADEGDYATLVAYLADAPASGNRILVKEDQTVTAQTVIPNDITIKFLDGSRILCATNIATSVVKFGSNIIIEGVLDVWLSHVGTTAIAVELDGDNVIGEIIPRNTSTGTITTAFHINANKTGNRIRGEARNLGGGVLTNIIVDNSTELSNLLVIVDEPNNKVIATGLVDFESAQILKKKSFEDNATYFVDQLDNTKRCNIFCNTITAGQTRIYIAPDSDGTLVLQDMAQTLSNKTLTSPVVNNPTGIVKADVGLGSVDNTSDATKNAAAVTLTNKTLGTGTKIALGSDADGDIYYRDAGILKRLAKGTDNQILVLVGGVPAWSDSGGSYTPTLTNIANVDASTVRSAFWTRIGNIVTVSGIIDALDITTTGISTSFRLTLPVVSNLGSFWDLAGNGSSDPVSSPIDPMGIVGDVANDEAIFRGFLNGSDVLKQVVSYKFSYEVI